MSEEQLREKIEFESTVTLAPYIKGEHPAHKIVTIELDKLESLIKDYGIQERLDELNNFGDDEGSFGAYYLKVSGGNLNDRIAELRSLSTETKEAA